MTTLIFSPNEKKTLTTMYHHWTGKCTIAVVLPRAGPPPNLATASDVNNGRPFGFGSCAPDQYFELLRNHQMRCEANTTQLPRNVFVALPKRHYKMV